MSDNDREYPHLRPVDQKRVDSVYERSTTDLHHSDIGYIHTVLAQCFLPYRDPKTDRWRRSNGDYSISLISGEIEDPKAPEGMRVTGLPYGAKPRLFQSYICTQAVKHQSPVIPIERSMSAMMIELGLSVSGGKEGSIKRFKDQITRFAACKFTIIGPGPKNTRRHVHAEPFRHFDVWFPNDPYQGSLWPSEITLTDDYYYSLKDHAIPYDFRALKPIQNKPRSLDIYFWMTQRLHRVDPRKPLFMRWKDLYEMFGGTSTLKKFKQNFSADLAAARASYSEARLEECTKGEGYRFFQSPPPVPKTLFSVSKPKG